MLAGAFYLSGDSADTPQKESAEKMSKMKITTLLMIILYHRGKG